MKKNPVEALYQLGCGNEMINCQIERGKIQATINNTKSDLKYLNYALKSGIYDPDIVIKKKRDLLKSLKKINPLVNKFNALYGESYNQLINSLNTQP